MTVPIETLHLFPELDKKLIELLRSLSPEDWNTPTLASSWTVKDIAAHLLDGNIRTISMMGDDHFGENPGNVNSYNELVNYLDQLNASWVKAMKRVSPGLLIHLLEVTGPAYLDCLKKLKPFDRAMFSVDWAGEQQSQNWFHIAREYTEKWHHQQQIREAVGKPGLMEQKFFSPLMHTFMQALPHTYRTLLAEEGTTLKIIVGDDAWILVKTESGWALSNTESHTPSLTMDVTRDTAWKLLTKGIDEEDGKKGITYAGDKSLGDPFLSMISVMAVR